RKSGKTAYAVLEMASNADYFVATAADEIIMPESGWLVLRGMMAEVTFYKNLFDKLGIAAEAIQVGEYKGAGEPFVRTHMSDPFREEIATLLDDTYTILAEAIAQRQGLPLDGAKALIDGGPYTPSAAKAGGLINRIAYTDQLQDAITKGLKD